MLIDDFDAKYTLGYNWILRSDPFCTNKEYTLYNINNRIAYHITSSCYTLLKIFSKNAISLNKLKLILNEKKIKLDWDGFWKFCEMIVPFDLLVKSDKILYSYSRIKPSKKLNRYEVPVSSTPLDIEMHLTHKCNLKCAHCFQESSPKSYKYGELSVNQWTSIFQQLEDNCVRSITISGGEPLFYPNFIPLFREIVNKRFNLTILTNGTLVNNENISLLSRPNVYLSISLDGHNSEIHDRLRGKGAFEKVLNNIKRLIKYGAKVSLSYTINSYNYQYLKEIVELACHLHVKAIVFAFTDRIGRAMENLNLILTAEERKIVKDSFIILEQKYKDSIELRLMEVASSETFQFVPNQIFCSAGTVRAAISSEGKLYPCIYAFEHKELIIGDLTKEQLKDLWEDTKNWELYRGGIKLEQIAVCNNCKLNKKCALKNCRLRNYDKINGLLNKPIECAIDYHNDL